MEPGAKYITGKPRPGPLTDLDGSFAGMVQVGAHAMMGTADGVLCHTQSSKTENRYWYNGVESGELAQCAAIAGGYGVPTIMVTGDEAACREAHEVLRARVRHGGRQAGPLARGGRAVSVRRDPPGPLRRAPSGPWPRFRSCQPYKLSLPIQAKKEYLVFDDPAKPGRKVTKEGTIDDVLKLLAF